MRDRVSGWLRPFVTGTGTRTIETEIGRRGFTFVVVDHRRLAVENPRLSTPRWFIGRDSASAAYFVSDEVPVEYRRYMLAHEVYEWCIVAEDRQDRCWRALKYELSLVPRRQRRVYVLFREQVFRELLDWMSGCPEYATNKALIEQKEAISIAYQYLLRRLVCFK